MQEARIQVFVHIPKTAGSTLVQVMRRQFKPGQILSYEDRSWAADIQKFPDRAAAGLNGIRCIMGHLPFGVHEIIGRDVHYVTMLRDPVEWTLSTYFYIKERHGRLPDDHGYPQRAAFAAVPRLSLDEFIGFLKDNGMANYQTRFVSGHIDPRKILPPYEELPQDALDLAKANLCAANTTFGLVEHFDLSLQLFKKCLGWRNLYYQSVNLTEQRVAQTQVPAATLARVQELHAMDAQLYETATAAFRQAIARAGLDSPYVLHRFRAANKGYSLLKAGVGHLRKLARRAMGTASGG